MYCDCCGKMAGCGDGQVTATPVTEPLLRPGCARDLRVVDGAVIREPMCTGVSNSAVLEVHGDPGMSIKAEFDKYEPHATGAIRGLKCVIPSKYQTIAWAATLVYTVEGPFPKVQARRGKLYVKVEQTRTSVFTHHDKTQGQDKMKVIEYFPVDESGVCDAFDDHGLAAGWPPKPGTGTCKIHSTTDMVMSLLVCPNADGEAFGTPKFDPDTGKDKKVQGTGSRGSWSRTADMTRGAWEPTLWRGKKWKAKYDMDPDHCGEDPVLEPPPPTIPTIKVELASLSRAIRPGGMSSGGMAVLSPVASPVVALVGAVPVSTGLSSLVSMPSESTAVIGPRGSEVVPMPGTEG